MARVTVAFVAVAQQSDGHIAYRAHEAPATSTWYPRPAAVAGKPSSSSSRIGRFNTPAE